MTGVAGNCEIWGTSATHHSAGRDGIIIESPRAGGRYFISSSAIGTVRQLDDLTRAHLTTWLIDQRLQGTPDPEVTTYSIDSARTLRSSSVPKRADRLLRHLVASTKRIGDLLRFVNSSQDELLAYSESRVGSEIRFLLTMLANQGWISQGSHSAGVDVTVLPGGYERVQELTDRMAASNQGFVAMWFDAGMETAFSHGIGPAIQDAGYTPMRIDRKQHNNKIDDEIIAEIRRSRFLVADFTHGEAGARGGVYYEAGFAHGLSIPVIFTIRADMIGQTHFDTRQYSHILWTEPLDLRKQLADRISATIGDGPLKPS
jgi:hypothetical protein